MTPQSKQFKPLLKIKISLILIIFNGLITASFIFLKLSIFQNLFISLLLTSTTIFLIVYLLRSLNQLKQSLEQLSKGEFKTRVNLHSNDEIQTLANLTNQIASNTDQIYQQLIQDKEIITSEKNKLEAILSSIGDGVIVLDMHKQVLMTNKAVEEITGYTQIELLGKPIESLISLVDKEGKKLQTKDYCPIDLNPTGSPQNPNIVALPSTYTLTGKNKLACDVRVFGSKVKGSIQAHLGCVLTLHNVSKEKIFHEMQIDFVSMASHELRTPLTSIVGYLATVMQEAEGLGEQQKKFLERALTSAQQLNSLVDNLLNVSRVERGAMSVNMQPIDIIQNITQVVDDHQTLATQKNLTLRFNPPDKPLPKVLADSMRINEVLTNLISNAIKYTKDSGQIMVTTIADKAAVIISVTDNGGGIPKDAVPHLFTKFFRVSGSLDQMQKGTGLGLYISKSIIDLHHGKIWVISDVGKGTTFSFSLPIATTLASQPTIAQLHTFTSA